MHLVDLAILVLLALSALLGYRSGLISSIASLLGLLAGIAIASWQYPRLLPSIQPFLHSNALSAAASFALIAIAVMLLTGTLGWLLKGLIHGLGLGWLDNLAGLLFGLLRGAVLVTLSIVTLAAFFPEIGWLQNARLAKYFLGSAHLTAHMTPHQLSEKILHGLHLLENESPAWLQPK